MVDRWRENKGYFACTIDSVNKTNEKAISVGKLRWVQQEWRSNAVISANKTYTY